MCKYTKYSYLCRNLFIMKKLLLLSLIAIAIFTSCGNCSNANDSKSTANETDETTYVKVMTYQDFLNKVWDLEANAEEFTFKGVRPCVIDFYATWCGPCRKVAPILEKLAEEYNGKVDFYKIDTDKETKLTYILKINSIPTIYFINGITQPEKIVGAAEEEFFRSQIEKLLGE